MKNPSFKTLIFLSEILLLSVAIFRTPLSKQGGRQFRTPRSQHVDCFERPVRNAPILSNAPFETRGGEVSSAPFATRELFRTPRSKRTHSFEREVTNAPFEPSPLLGGGETSTPRFFVCRLCFCLLLVLFLLSFDVRFLV